MRAFRDPLYASSSFTPSSRWSERAHGVEMFPTSRIFDSTTCPDYTTCKLSPCLFSHAPPAGVVGIRGSQPRASTSALPPPLVRASSSSSSSTKRTGSQDVAGSSTKVAKTEPKALSCSKAAASGSTSTGTASRELSLETGPPRIATGSVTHTPLSVRSKMLSILYDQFLLTYGSLPDPIVARSLAHHHAKRQESHIYEKSNKATYRNSTVSALGRLKKRPLALVVSETGTLEDDLARAAAAEDAEKSKLSRARIDKYVSKRALLERYDYMVDVPAGPGGTRPNEEGFVTGCDRCGAEFMVKGVLNEADRRACAYHYGRLVTEKLGGIKERVFSCCPSPGAVTCQLGPHVFRDKSIEALHSRIPFIHTSSLSSFRSPTIPPHDIVALDCELVYTTSGMALARLTVVDSSGLVILDAHVRPHGSVIDLNTRFSGVKQSDVEMAVLDVVGVREELGRLVGVDTIIVGHGLENDLKALRIVHLTVVDTAIIYTHPRGIPWRHALRNLSRDVLGKFIQDGDASLGHSAVEDSQAALELVRHKMKEDATPRR